ncbi:MAG: isochorismatase family protein [Euryarchaeota archaeon]|nr:isochorismatase family protein [Euryarchaeota archaeon]
MERDDTALVVVDMQNCFIPVISNIKEVISSAEKAIKGFKVLEMPVIATEQYPKGLGTTVNEISGLLETEPLEKIHFSCFGEKDFVDRLKKFNVKNLAILGIETHVCVFNTALDALNRGYAPHVIVDAVASRKRIDHESSLKRMTQEGVYLTTVETLLFQLLQKAGTSEFKAISKLIK